MTEHELIWLGMDDWLIKSIAETEATMWYEEDMDYMRYIWEN